MGEQQCQVPHSRHAVRSRMRWERRLLVAGSGGDRCATVRPAPELHYLVLGSGAPESGSEYQPREIERKIGGTKRKMG
jgi:hypothetical protein